MTVKELIEDLGTFKPSDRVLIANDQELNTLFKGFEVAKLEGEDSIVIYGLTGQEYEES